MPRHCVTRLRNGVLPVTLAAASLSSTCWPSDPQVSGPLILDNRLTDSVRAVLRMARYDRELADTVLVTETWLAPGEQKSTDVQLSLFQLVSCGVPTSHPRLLAVYTRRGLLWQTQLWAEGLRDDRYVVVIDREPPEPCDREGKPPNRR